MIELSPTTALMLYLGMTLSVLLGLWIFQHYRYRHKKILSSEKELFICEYCHFAYLDEGTKKITHCPQCQSYNKVAGV
jgi:ribosomal protein L37AE/L43A